MGESNAEWGELAAHNEDMAAAWDDCDDLPEPGANAKFDAFLESKHLTRGALIRLGAKIRDETELAIAYGTGLKFRDIVTGRRYNYIESTFPRLKILKSQQRPPAGVIVSEGETDGARLTDLYPELDVAVLPSGAQSFKPSMTEQLGAYPLVLVGLDNDAAGTKGVQKIIKHVPTAIHFPPPEGKTDWCEVVDGEDIPDLPAPPNVEQVEGIIFEDLAPFLQTALDPPPYLFAPLIYVEGVHWFDGHPGSGKTSLVMHICSTLMDDNTDVIWFDYEGGIKPSMRRLRAVGALDEQILAHFHYAGWPGKAEDKIEDLMARWPGALVVFDSASKALALAGKNENDNAEVTAWTMKLVQACKNQESPIVVIDHISKSREATKSQYSRGAGAKLADTDVHWRVHIEEEFNRTTQGLISLSRKKDREGEMPFSQWYAVGDGAGMLTFEPIERPDSDEAVEKSAASADHLENI